MASHGGAGYLPTDLPPKGGVYVGNINVVHDCRRFIVTCSVFVTDNGALHSRLWGFSDAEQCEMEKMQVGQLQNHLVSMEG